MIHMLCCRYLSSSFFSLTEYLYAACVQCLFVAVCALLLLCVNSRVCFCDKQKTFILLNPNIRYTETWMQQQRPNWTGLIYPFTDIIIPAKKKAIRMAKTTKHKRKTLLFSSFLVFYLRLLELNDVLFDCLILEYYLYRLLRSIFYRSGYSHAHQFDAVQGILYI